MLCYRFETASRGSRHVAVGVKQNWPACKFAVVLGMHACPPNAPKHLRAQLPRCDSYLEMNIMPSALVNAANRSVAGAFVWAYDLFPNQAVQGVCRPDGFRCTPRARYYRPASDSGRTSRPPSFGCKASSVLPCRHRPAMISLRPEPLHDQHFKLSGSRICCGTPYRYVQPMWFEHSSPVNTSRHSTHAPAAGSNYNKHKWHICQMPGLMVRYNPHDRDRIHSVAPGRSTPS